MNILLVALSTMCVRDLDFLVQVDDAGGMTKFIDSGAAKLRIEEAATRAQVGCSLSPAVVQLLLAG